METEKYVKALPFFDMLTKQEKELVLKNIQIKEYTSEELIHSAESDCLGLIKILSGGIFTRMVSGEGREITLYTLNTGEIDVLSASCVVHQITFETQVVAKEDTRLLILPSACLSKLKSENLSVRCFIYEELGNRFSVVMRTFEKMLFERIDTRIASLLVKMTVETGENTLYITQEKLAEEINSVREVVARTIRKLVKEKLVSTHRGRIEILDLEGIKKFC